MTLAVLSLLDRSVSPAAQFPEPPVPRTCEGLTSPDRNAHSWDVDGWLPVFLEGSNAMQACVPLPPLRHASMSSPLCELSYSYPADPWSSISLPFSAAPATASESLSSLAAYPDELQSPGTCDILPFGAADSPISQQQLLHLDSCSDATFASSADCQLDWQGLPREWGGATSASSVPSLQPSSSGSYDFLPVLQPVCGVGASWLSTIPGVIPPANMLSPVSSLQSLTQPSTLPDSPYPASIEISNISRHAPDSAPSFALPIVRPAAALHDQKTSSSAPSNTRCTLSPSSACSPVEARSPAVSGRRRTRSSALAASSSAAPISCQPPAATLVHTRRKRGRPRLYDTDTPVRDAATMASGSAAQTGAPDSCLPLTRSDIAPKRRGAKPKYLCATKEEAIAKRRDRNRATALATYYRRKAHTLELHNQLADIQVEATALRTLLDLAELSPPCAAWVGPLMAHGCAASEVLHVLLPDDDVHLEVNRLQGPT